MPEKNAHLNAIRACFSTRTGQILVAGAPAGKKLSPHCTLLAYDPRHVPADPAIEFVGGLEFVTLDDSANYPQDISGNDDPLRRTRSGR